VKQIQAGLSNVGYVETGPVNGTPVVLLHGWPYDVYSFVDVAEEETKPEDKSAI